MSSPPSADFFVCIGCRNQLVWVKVCMRAVPGYLRVVPGLLILGRMPNAKQAAIAASLLLAGVLILIAGEKHYSNASKHPDILLGRRTVDKYGIPMTEDEDGVSATEMEQTDLLMLHTVQQLESKVNSLSSQMKTVVNHHKALGGSSSDVLKSKVKALSTSMLDTIQAVQHLSAQVANLETRHNVNGDTAQSLPQIARMIQPQADAARFITSRSSSPRAFQAGLEVISNAEHHAPKLSRHISKSTNSAAKQTGVPDIISRLSSDIELASSVLGKKKTPQNSDASVHPEGSLARQDTKISPGQVSALKGMMAQISNILTASQTPEAQAVSENAVSDAPAVPVLAPAAVPSAPAALAPAPAAPQEAEPEPAERGMAYDSPSTFPSALLSDSLGTVDLKARIAAMQAQVQALAQQEHATLNALPLVEDRISRDRAVLSDGLQSLQIAQDRLTLATKAAQGDNAGPAATATQALAERREAAIQAEVTAEIHRLAEAKRSATQGPQVARTLHDRRAQLRRLESQLQRATLLEKARAIESTKDFAG
jgi:hypothetical protein